MENLEPHEAEKIVELNKDYRDKKYAWLRYLILLPIILYYAFHGLLAIH